MPKFNALQVQELAGTLQTIHVTTSSASSAAWMHLSLAMVLLRVFAQLSIALCAAKPRTCLSACRTRAVLGARLLRIAAAHWLISQLFSEGANAHLPAGVTNSLAPPVPHLRVLKLMLQSGMIARSCADALLLPLPSRINASLHTFGMAPVLLLAAWALARAFRLPNVLSTVCGVLPLPVDFWRHLLPYGAVPTNVHGAQVGGLCRLL